jgi:glycosyltransferase involved in cell wall biosynthesis
VVELLEDPERRREIGLTNRRRAEERFSVERMIEQYRGIYEELTVDRIAAASARHER